jgi:deoxycytidylate deaminase
MYAAYAASFASGDLSRQVGAAVVNESGDLLSTGWNDVTKFGGGLYGSEDKPFRDMDLGEDSNDSAKADIAEKIRAGLGPEWSDSAHQGKIIDALRAAGFFDITEFQRPVHAEMEAMLACARNGRSTRNSTLYVTTFPCHNCTKHIIAAGFIKVFYIEPYAKSKALTLHKDAITTYQDQPDKIPFVAFIGVGPRRFLDLFSLSLGTGYNIFVEASGQCAGRSRRIWR